MRKNKGLWRIKRGAAHGPSGRSKEHALFCCWPKGPRFQKRLAKRVVDAGLPRSGSSGLLMSDSKACLIYPEPADRRFFPPLVVAYLVKLACQMPDQAGRSLSLWFCAELAQELERRKIVETISAQSVQRMLASSSNPGAFTIGWVRRAGIPPHFGNEQKIFAIGIPAPC